ncbi:MAG TPA: bifunctional DNA primase/polymerase [Propionibacteriaceae bacterium]|nr:bifunctional DNA primase/polymerase [Propionibacteriaceae bacterium]
MRSLEALEAAAVAYADRGWRVFPVLPGLKRPACPGHPAARCDRSDPWCRDGHTGWEQRATTSPSRIRRAWSSVPYGIGIACGPSRLLVVDTDQPKTGFTPTATAGGEAALTGLADSHPDGLPPTWTVTTPSGGLHRYYTAPAGLDLSNTAGRLAPLIDTRGRGGYVLAPPTGLPAGRYIVRDDHDPVRLPDWLQEALGRPHTATQGCAQPAPMPVAAGYVTAAVAGETAKVRNAPAGQRNHALFCAAVALGQLVGAGRLDAHAARQALTDAATGPITAGAYTAGQAAATITSGLDRGTREPRHPHRRTAA